MQIARPFGIPLRLHWSFWFLVLFLVGAATLGNGPVLGYGPAFLVGVAIATMLVGSVALHEYGHALAAKQYGITTRHITLYPFGGIAAIEGMPEDPDQETVIAFAGPAVNLVLAAMGGLMLGYTQEGTLVWALARVFAMANLSMGLFNLIPAFPMDGGRILRSLLAKRMGWAPASRLAVRIGRLFSIGFVAAGLAWGNWGLVLMGAFLHVALNNEYERLVAQHWQESTGRPAPWAQGSEGASEPVGALLP